MEPYCSVPATEAISVLAPGDAVTAEPELAFPGHMRPAGLVKPQVDEAEILAIERPEKAPWTYYLLRLLGSADLQVQSAGGHSRGFEQTAAYLRRR
jgi:hypothetical protein